ncbi:MAG: NADH:flavin oxidoreductase [Halanaerobiales bacterium]
MAEIRKFYYRTLEDLRKEIQLLGLNIPISENFDVLSDAVELSGGTVIPNRLAIHPMEGADANPDGTPGDLNIRRYQRYADGGSGLIWFEAVAINQMGRANDQQCFLNKETVDQFKELVEMVRERAEEKDGEGFNPYLVIQLTHSGRFGQHNKILYHHDLVDNAAAANIDPDHPVMKDEELERLEDYFVEAAELAREAGFDAVDIKACHRYLLSENLAAFTREGKYGGDYQNRTRLMKNAIKKINERVDIDLVTRLNIYDAIPYPYGWGSDKNGNEQHDDPRRLIRELDELGIKLINITAATPYLYPHINRPYDQPGNLGYQPPEHPLLGVERLLRLARVTSEETKNAKVVGTGYSYLREFAPYVAAAVIERGWSDIIGFGRQAFAYPDFARDIISNKSMVKRKVCVTCSKCAELKAQKKHSGCVVRDRDVYLPIYQQLLEEYKKQA